MDLASGFEPMKNFCHFCFFFWEFWLVLCFLTRFFTFLIRAMSFYCFLMWCLMLLMSAVSFHCFLTWCFLFFKERMEFWFPPMFAVLFFKQFFSASLQEEFLEQNGYLIVLPLIYYHLRFHRHPHISVLKLEMLTWATSSIPEVLKQ